MYLLIFVGIYLKFSLFNDDFHYIHKWHIHKQHTVLYSFKLSRFPVFLNMLIMSWGTLHEVCWEHRKTLQLELSFLGKKTVFKNFLSNISLKQSYLHFYKLSFLCMEFNLLHLVIQANPIQISVTFHADLPTEQCTVNNFCAAVCRCKWLDIDRVIPSVACVYNSKCI